MAKKTSESTNPIGRPTKYREEMCDVVIKEMSEGASITEVCGELGIFKEAFYAWCKKYENFSNAVKKGRSLSKAWWMRQGRKNLDNKDFSATLWYMNMKNRHKWTDRQQTTHNVTGKLEKMLSGEFFDE